MTSKDELWELSTKMWEWKATGKVTAYGINPFPHMSIMHCSHILGFSSVADMYNNWSPKTSSYVKMMLGPNGLTVYKTLLAQANDREEQKHADVPE